MKKDEGRQEEKERKDDYEGEYEEWGREKGKSRKEEVRGREKEKDFRGGEGK